MEDKQTDRQTDRQTDKQTDKRTRKKMILNLHKYDPCQHFDDWTHS